MAYDEEAYGQLAEHFELLCNIIGQNRKENGLKADLSRLEDMIDRKIPDTLKQNAPEDFYELYTDFKAEYGKFRDFILYDRLIGRNIVALGGGFSSGKSSFLNALLGRNVLPADIDPSTSVPTYIVKGEKHEVTGINVFDTKVRMKPRDLRKIAHGFGEVENGDGERISEAVTLGHILENLFFSTPLQTYDNIAFLDTPGYSRPDSEEYSARTDARIARGQLNGADYILWFVQADAGTITEEDIKFLKTLREEIPKFIILSKADKKNPEDLRAIMEKIRYTLHVKGVRFADIAAFTNRPEQAGDPQLRGLLEEEAEKIRGQLARWDSRIYESGFAANFKRLFVRCKEFYEEEIEEESRKLSRLNTSLTGLAAEEIDSEILEPLQLLAQEARRRIGGLRDMRGKLKELQDEFFTEIKFIADTVGIAMPEPSEVDLLQDRARNPLKTLEAYRKEAGIAADGSMAAMLRDIFGGIQPVIGQSAGGSEYRKALGEQLLDIFRGIRPVIGQSTGGSEYRQEPGKKTQDILRGIQPATRQSAGDSEYRKALAEAADRVCKLAGYGIRQGGFTR